MLWNYLNQTCVTLFCYMFVFIFFVFHFFYFERDIDFMIESNSGYFSASFFLFENSLHENYLLRNILLRNSFKKNKAWKLKHLKKNSVLSKTVEYSISSNIVSENQGANIYLILKKSIEVELKVVLNAFSWVESFEFL